MGLVIKGRLVVKNNEIVPLSRGKVLKCSNCSYVYYCNRVCQQEAWSVHKRECVFLRKIAPRTVPDAARVLSRIILKLNNGGEYEKGYYNDKCYRQFKDLMTRKYFPKLYIIIMSTRCSTLLLKEIYTAKKIIVGCLWIFYAGQRKETTKLRNIRATHHLKSLRYFLFCSVVLELLNPKKGSEIKKTMHAIQT